MLSMNTKTLNYNASSMIEDTNIVSMNANFNGERLYFSYEIINFPLFKLNREFVEKDFLDFKEKVLFAVNALLEEEEEE